MVRSIDIKYFGVGLLVLILALLYGLTQTSIYQSSPDDLSVGITLDLLITIPFVYFLIIRKTKIPKITVLSVFILCLVLASFIIPVEHQDLLSSIKLFAIPMVELGVLGFILYKTRSITKQYKDAKNTSNDFFDSISEACAEVFPGRLGKFLALEIGVMYYGFFARKIPELKVNEYTYFEKSGIRSVVGAFLFVVLIETFAVHVMVHQWNAVAAWILTGLSLYTCLQIIALIRSMSRRRIAIDHENEVLQLRYGFFNHSSIPFHHIKEIELNRRSLPQDKSIVQFSPLGMLDSHNTIIRLSCEHTLHGFYGIKKKYQALALFIDDKERFLNEIQSIIALQSDDSQTQQI